MNVSRTGPISPTFSFKIVLLGEGCVGKTSVVLRYVEDKFSDIHVTTLQASFLQKKINLSGKRIRLAIWDTAGQERFHALGPIYYRDANGAILVYDITDQDSFQKVKNWVKELKKMMGDDICITIAGNKTDLEKNRTVIPEEAEKYAKMVGAQHFHTSAKNNINIEELFLDLSERMVLANEQVQRNRAPIPSRNNMVVVEDEERLTSSTPFKSGCCG